MRKALVGLLFQVGVFPVLAQSVIIADGPLEFCHGDSVMLCVEPDTYVSYVWSNGRTTSCVIITESGEYWPIMMDNLGNIDSTLASQPVSVTVHAPDPYMGIGQDTIFVNEPFESYQWYFIDTLIEGATDSFIVAPGISNPCCFSVEVTDGFGCIGRSNCIDFGSACFTDVDELAEDKISVYPNPANSYMTISSEQGSIVHVNLFDIAGKAVNTLPVLATTEKAIIMDVSGTPPGLYLLEAHHADGRKAVQKVVVQQ